MKRWQNFLLHVTRLEKTPLSRWKPLLICLKINLQSDLLFQVYVIVCEIIFASVQQELSIEELLFFINLL